jgi:ATP-dependent RNA helicase DeaD
LHGDLSQAQRDGVMKSLEVDKSKCLLLLMLQLVELMLTILPRSKLPTPDEIETYNHRSGRTGRAGKLGTSIVIVKKVNCVRFFFNRKNHQTKLKKNNPSSEICEIQIALSN